MELAVCAAIVTIFNLLWTFYLHGKVNEKSLAAKTQQIIRDWKLGNKDSWEAEFDNISDTDEYSKCQIKKVRQSKDGAWTYWLCGCGQKSTSHTSNFKADLRKHKDVKSVEGRRLDIKPITY